MALLAYSGRRRGRASAPSRRFRALATPIADMVRPMPYPEIYRPEPEDYHPVAVVAHDVRRPRRRGTAEAIIERIEASSAQMAVAQLRVLGGAMARVPPRRPPSRTAAAASWSTSPRSTSAPASARSTRPGSPDWRPSSTTATPAPTGFLADEGEERIRAAYPGPTWDRLAAIKARYDPDNVFRLNQNVPPAGEPTREPPEDLGRLVAAGAARHEPHALGQQRHHDAARVLRAGAQRDRARRVPREAEERRMRGRQEADRHEVRQLEQRAEPAAAPAGA